MDEVSQLTISGSHYNEYSKALLALTKNLRAVGGQAELDLPRIVVTGNQSAGKSSVVERISGISVPRDAGTCTRCPMECRMSSSQGPWTCQILLRKEFDADGDPLDEVSETLFGGPITDKAHVELALRRAQAAILNPDIAHTAILKMDEDEVRALHDPETLAFSRNVVCVDLEGPDLADLSFIDLPGLIQNAAPDVVRLVEEMVISHIRGNCLILVALPMTDDIENQKAMRLALNQDPQGLRTIGVLTKVDMLSHGSINARDRWIDVIEGRRYKLAHGYFCTRQPDDAARAAGITPAKAQADEATFFAATEPWATLARQHKQRLGMGSLVTRLSSQLVQIINETLPNIHRDASAQLAACTQELDTLPRAIHVPPTTHMFDLITQFCGVVQENVRGGPYAGPLVQDNNKIFEDLRDSIWKTAPVFSAVEAPAQRHSRAPAEALLRDQTPCYLDDMREHIKRSRARELSTNIPFSATESLIVASQHTWLSLMKKCLKEVQDALGRCLLSSIKDVFRRFENLQTVIRIFVIEFAREQHDLCSTLLTSFAESEATPHTKNDGYLTSCTEKWLAKYKDQRAGKVPERPIPHPQLLSEPGSDEESIEYEHDSDSDSGTGANGDSPSRAREPSEDAHADAAADRTERLTNKVLAGLAALGFSGLAASDLGRLHAPDVYATELKLMADTRAYFQVAFKRVIDVVPGFVDTHFVMAFARGLQTFLIEKLEPGAPSAGARCAHYLSEDPSMVARRDELIAKRKRLESLDKELNDFGI